MKLNSLLCISLLSLFCTPNAHAFIFINYSSALYQQGERPVSKAPLWSNGTATFYLNNDLTAYSGSLAASFSAAQFLAAFNGAIATWNNTCHTNLKVVSGGTTTNVRNSSDNINSVSFDNRTIGEGNVFGNTTTGAWAVPAMSTTTAIWSDCDIQVNGLYQYTLGTTGAANEIDLQSVLTHEIGHCLGLDHTYGTDYNGATYSTTNYALLNSVMRGTALLGSTAMRYLSQDDLDGMQCVYPNTGSYRDGTFCTSYTGTGGNGIINGLVSGGPLSTRTCGNGEYAEVTASSGSGGGCMSSALASDGTSRPPSVDIGLILVLFLPFLIWVKRRIRHWIGALFVIFFLGATPANAAFEIAYDYNLAKPAAINSASGISSTEGSFSTTTAESDRTKFSTNSALYFAVSGLYVPSLSLGFFWRNNLSKSVAWSGYNSSNTLLMQKSSTLSGWTAGITAKYFLNDDVSPSAAGNKGDTFFIEAQIGAGKTKFAQTFLDPTSSFFSADNRSSLTAAAFAVETNIFIGVETQFFSMLSGVFKVGFMRERSTYYTVESVSGGRYSGISQGDRLSLQNNEDIRLDRSGLAFTAGLILDL